MKSVSITLFSIFTLVGLSIAQPTLVKRAEEPEEQICILMIVPCPEECPTTCVYPTNVPCPMTHQPKCPTNKKKPHHGGHGNGRGHN